MTAMEHIKLAVAIILYHPDDKVADYIISIKPYFGVVYLFDNTESKECTDRLRKRFQNIQGIKYATQNDNKGLAYGLNVCCNSAYKEGFQWIMLFDQDSVITQDLVGGMCEFIKEYDEEKFAIAAPMIDDCRNRSVREKKAKRKKEVITSGMVLKLEAFKKNGYFLNALFVDAVDIEYCLRLAKKGYFILENNWVKLAHNQYDTEQVLGGYKVNKYSALRHYYMARGYCYITEHYDYEKVYLEGFRRSNWERFKVMLLCDKGRPKKLLAVILGILDYKMGKFGKCRWKILF